MKFKSLHLKNLILVAILALMSGSAWAYDFSAENEGKTIYYSILPDVDHQVAVTYRDIAWNTYSGAVVVPSTVVNSNNNESYTVTAIGSQAFRMGQYPPVLTSVSLPETITSIGSEAFYKCDQLTTVNIPDAVTIIGDNAFRSCSALTSITLGSGVTTIDDAAFYNSGLTSIIIPNSVTTIGAHAFDLCSDLATVTIGTGVTTINNYAFENCTSLAEINFNAANCTMIGYNYGNSCWSGCTHDCTLNIGNNVTGLPTRAFYGFSSLKVINFGTHANFYIGEEAFLGCGVTTVVIPNNVTGIGNKAFDGCSAMTSLTIGTNVDFIGYWAFKGCNHLESVYYNATNCHTISDNVLTWPVWEGAGNGTNCTLIIGSNVTNLPDKVFYRFTGLKSFSFASGSTLTTISGYAFNGCTGLTAISIPSHVTTIKYSAFYGCSAVTSLNLGSVTTIEQNAFEDCSGLLAINIPNTVTSIGRNIFRNCSAATSLTLGTGITAISPGAFYGCSSLGSFTIPANITSIDGAGDASGAFENCTSLTTLTIPNIVTGIGFAAFRGCTGLTEVSFGTGVTYIANEAFNGCTNLTEVTTGAGVTTIGYQAFRGCTGITSVTIGAGVTEIGQMAFKGCTNLATVNYNATNCTNTPSITGEYGDIWYGCNKLRTVNVGENVTTLPKNIFYNADLTVINFLGDNPQLTTIGNGALASTNITSIDIPDGVTSIGNDAFHWCYGLTSVTIPDNVATIGSSAFEYCYTIKDVVIGSGVTTIGEKAFLSCTALEEIWSKNSTPPTIQANTFFSASKTLPSTPVFVPKGSKTAYEEAANWNTFTNIHEYLRFVGGNSGNNWNLATNWSPNAVPTSDEAVVIDGSYDPEILDNHIAQPYKIILNDGRKIIIDDGSQLLYDEAVQVTAKKEISTATQYWNTASDGWYFIASPIATNIVPSAENHMLTPDDATYITSTNPDGHSFDLYAYDEQNGIDEGDPKPWVNYRAHVDDFVISNGHGYLYASANDPTLEFTGVTKPYSTEENDNKVFFDYIGWHLVGNPYTFAVTVDRDFASLHNASAVTNVNHENGVIMPCEGIAVYGNIDEYITFTKYVPVVSSAPKPSSLNMLLTNANVRDAKPIDNAIVSFGEGNGMPKFEFGEQNAKLYIPQNGKDYAIVYSEGQGEMPLNFEANENGSYTITFDAENAEMTYLHLIDNLTGADIDLLVEPSYIFEAKTSDYESRFRLVFVCGDANDDNDGDNDFAFFANGQLIIANEGQATLQVIDITGRILSSETINGSTSVSLKETAGVYMLRLVNGEKVKVQKVIIK